MKTAEGEKTNYAEAIEVRRNTPDEPQHDLSGPSAAEFPAGPGPGQYHRSASQHNHPSRQQAQDSTSSETSSYRPSSSSTPAFDDFGGGRHFRSPLAGQSSLPGPKKDRANVPVPLHLNAPGATPARSPTALHFKTTGSLQNSPRIGQSPRRPASFSIGTPPLPQQAVNQPNVAFTPGSPEEEGVNGYFSADHRRINQHQQQDRHHLTEDTDTGSDAPASFFSRAKAAAASVLMVASPRLPFYAPRDEDSITNDASSPFTPMSHSLSPQMSRQHSGNSPSLAFTGPSGLFAPSPKSTSKSLLSPSLHSSGFGSVSLSPGAANGQNRGHNQKRSYYKDKDASISLYPSSGTSYDSGFRRGNGPAPVKTSFFRVPRSIARLASRRSRVLPFIILCVVLFFYALGSARRSSLYDAAQQASVRQVGRFFEAADARVGHLNPMKWALEKSGEAAHQQKTFSGTDGVVEKFDVEVLDPAGPLAQKGTVGSAEKRYASWEGGRRDSRMLIQEGKPHPIPKLMARAKQRWHALKSRQSKTFADAVREYERRYGRMPPKGFDRWYAFAKHHDVQLIDEFNIIEEDFRMFRAFSGESFRARVSKLAKETGFAWSIKVENGKAISDGELKNHDRARGVLHLIRKFAHELPDLHIVYNGHDTARMNVGWEERMRLDALVQAGEYDEFNATDTEMKPQIPSVAPGWGMSTICPTDSAVRQDDFDYGFVNKAHTGHEMPGLPEGASGTVIDSFLGYMDVCNSPQYRHFHSSSSYVFPWHPGPTMPLFTAGVQSHFADIHCVITEQFGLESRHDPTWEEKPFDRLVWRGQTSGPLFDKGTAWRSSHRARLHILSHQEDGSRTIALTDEEEIVKAVEVPNYQLNPLFLDTGFVGPPVQCIKEDGTCDEMKEVFNGFDPRISFERASLFKYVLDVDGNSWSGRFPRLMASNAAVVKATIYREFWTDWCIPWLHFIPIQVDYSDLWDVMAFFRGGLGGEGAHDEAAKSIAIAGKNWAREHFRYEDMEAYTFRQYLEYARLWSDDRDGMTYKGEVEGYEPIWSAEEVVVAD